jgi:hypothetical protein
MMANAYYFPPKRDETNVVSPAHCSARAAAPKDMAASVRVHECTCIDTANCVVSSGVFVTYPSIRGMAYSTAINSFPRPRGQGVPVGSAASPQHITEFCQCCRSLVLLCRDHHMVEHGYHAMVCTAMQGKAPMRHDILSTIFCRVIHRAKVAFTLAPPL